MLDFEFYSPTYVVFGRNSLEKLEEQLRRNNATNVLVHFGKSSVKDSGLLDSIIKKLDNAGINYRLLGGVRANPEIELVREGIKLCKENKIDFVLGVGGGSAIDSAKAIAVGTLMDSDVWECYECTKIPNKALKIGTILTLSATGTELSSRSVISNDKENKKLGTGGEAMRPVFSILNPEYTFSVNKWQTASGTIDILMHTLERYFTKTKDVSLTDSLSEALLRNVINAGRIACEKPDDYEARATLMWAGSLSHNDLMGLGRSQDWACHKLEHEMSVVDTKITHGAGLAVIFPHWARYVMHEDLDRFVRLAKEVFGVKDDGLSKEEVAKQGIIAFENYAKSIGMPSSLREFSLNDEDCITMSKRISEKFGHIGGFKKLYYEDVLNIYRSAL